MKNYNAYDIIETLDIDELIVMKERKKYLENHPYAIWQSKDGKYWYTTFPDNTRPRGVRQIRRNSERELGDAIVDFWMNKSNDKTVFEIFTEWNENRLKMKKIIQSTYISIKSKYKRYFSEISDKRMCDIKPIEWCEFLENCIVKENLNKDSFEALKCILISMIKYSYKHEYIDYTSNQVLEMIDISPNAFRVNKKEDKNEVFNEEETPLIINYLISNKTLYNCGILLMFVTGIRVGELLALKHGDFDNNILKIRRTKTTIINERGHVGRGVKESPKTKSGNRDIIVPKSFLWLMNYFAVGNPDEYVFLTRHGNIAKQDAIANNLKNICNNLGIPYRSPHKIRKTYISILMDNGLDSRFIIAQSGHSDISCAENYYHKERKDIKKKIEIIDSIPDFQET